MEGKRSIGEAVDDSRLLKQIGTMFDRVDPVPEAVLEGARAAFAWRSMDALLAQLVDSEQLAGTAVRAQGEQHLLTFEAPGLTVAIEATEVNGARKLVGQLVPSGAHHVSLEAAALSGQALTAPVDHLGRFTLNAVPAGMVRLKCALPDGTQVVTEWVDT